MTLNQAISTKPILRWPGGKSRMLKHLLPLIPPHTCYCEPFAGGLALLLAKPRSPIEVISDVNGDLVALYRCIQYHLPELHREISFLISSRQILKDFVRQPGLTDIQRAARFYYKNRTSFGGGMTSFAIAKTQGGGAHFDPAHYSDLLGKARERLARVVIENVSYDRCFTLYDAPTSFFFMDPPYLAAKTNAYEGWREADLVEFKKAVDKLKGKWLITLDDSQFNRDLFKGCRIQAIETRCGTVNQRTTSKTFGEIIIQPA